MIRMQERERREGRGNESVISSRNIHRSEAVIVQREGGMQRGRGNRLGEECLHVFRSLPSIIHHCDREE